MSTNRTFLVQPSDAQLECATCTDFVPFGAFDTVSSGYVFNDMPATMFTPLHTSDMHLVHGVEKTVDLPHTSGAVTVILQCSGCKQTLGWKYLKSNKNQGNVLFRDDLVKVHKADAQVLGPLVAGPNNGNGEDVAALNELLTAFMAKNNIPGMSVAWAPCPPKRAKGEPIVVHTHTIGYRTADGELLSPSHPLRLASCGKTITAVMVLRLVGLGWLSLSDRILPLLEERFGTSFSDANEHSMLAEVTVQHCLQHTAGGWSNEKRCPTYRGIASPLTLLQTVFKEDGHLQFTPGTHFAYSNFGYFLLGRIIEVVVNRNRGSDEQKQKQRTYEEIVRDELFPLCGIDAANVPRFSEEAATATYFEFLREGEDGSTCVFKTVSPSPSRTVDSHGGWCLTPADLVRFSAAIENGLLFSDDCYKAMYTTLPTDIPGGYEAAPYGLGIRWNGNTRHHTGMIAGTSSALAYARSRSLTWALVANSTVDAGVMDISWDIVGILQKIAGVA